MNIHQQQSNTDKSINGNKYEKILYDKIKKLDKHLGLSAFEKQKKFYYKEKTPEDEIREIIEKDLGTYNKKNVDKAIDIYLNSHKNTVIRDDKKYFKRCDVKFKTDNKYFINGKLKNIRVIIDTTTSARGDRIKAKAQDAAVYKTFNVPSIYVIVLPNDSYFDEHDYSRPENEKKYCKSIIYDNNFCNLYKDENVDLILQENDLIAFLEYIKKRKEKDIKVLIENFKKYHFKDMHERRKKDLLEFKEVMSKRILDKH